MSLPDGHCLHTAPCGTRTKWPSRRHIPLYQIWAMSGVTYDCAQFRMVGYGLHLRCDAWLYSASLIFLDGADFWSNEYGSVCKLSEKMRWCIWCTGWDQNQISHELWVVQKVLERKKLSGSKLNLQDLKMNRRKYRPLFNYREFPDSVACNFILSGKDISSNCLISLITVSYSQLDGSVPVR